MNLFHYAFKVKSIEETRRFYVDIMGCKEGRSTENWIDFEFFGHQLSAHLSSTLLDLDYCGLVDGVSVPIPHFGCIISVAQFKELKLHLVEHDIHFLLPAQIRYKNEAAEQHTMFFLDPSNNPIEIKAFTHPNSIF